MDTPPKNTEKSTEAADGETPRFFTLLCFRAHSANHPITHLKPYASYPPLPISGYHPHRIKRRRRGGLPFAHGTNPTI